MNDFALGSVCTGVSSYWALSPCKGFCRRYLSRTWYSSVLEGTQPPGPVDAGLGCSVCAARALGHLALFLPHFPLRSHREEFDVQSGLG